MLTLRELVFALAGVSRLLRFDAAGLSCFDSSRRGFWRSFWAAVLLMPVWGMLVMSGGQEPPANPIGFLTAELCGYVVGWLAYALLALRISDILGASGRYCGYMAAYNWFQLVQGLIWVPATLAARSGSLSTPVIALLWVVCYATLMVYNWFIARKALVIGGGSAALLVVIDFLLGMLIGGIADGIAGAGL